MMANTKYLISGPVKPGNQSNDVKRLQLLVRSGNSATG